VTDPSARRHPPTKTYDGTPGHGIAKRSPPNRRGSRRRNLKEPPL
jgi:hypothetical protein